MNTYSAIRLSVILIALVLFTKTVKAAGDSLKVDSLPSGTVSASSTGDTLVVTGRLVEIPGKFVPNDVYDYVYIMKYRVLTVENGVYAHKELLVGHYNPLIARNMVKDEMDPVVDGTVERFMVGDKHRLTLIAPIETVWKDAVEDEYYDTELVKYYAVRADLLK